jgi:hypothetical protein
VGDAASSKVYGASAGQGLSNRLFLAASTGMPRKRPTQHPKVPQEPTHPCSHCLWRLGSPMLQVLPALLEHSTNAYMRHSSMAAAHCTTLQAAVT